MRKKHFFQLTATLLLAAVLYFSVGYFLIKPAVSVIGVPPIALQAESVGINMPDGRNISGWFTRGEPQGGAVLLLHGVRSDRRQMLKRAMFLKQAGYSVLLIDLPAHGESAGSAITFGAKESLAVVAALNFLQQKLPAERMGVIGVSLGAASTVLSKSRPALSAVVIESMYPTIQDAVSDRLTMRLGAVGAYFAPILLWQLPLQTGVTTNELQPIQHIAKIKAPLLIASGADDQHTRWDETERLFAAAAEPKFLWRVEGAAHVDLHAFQPQEYEQKILQFFEKYLRATH